MPWVIPGIDRNNKALGTVGHTGTWVIDPNASGECDSLARNLALKKLGGLAAWSGN
ncbi:MAG: hypothetical protein F6K26_40945 [Moorea sp. SIO2I5]|nr:hypothetical protein [Moorena sp. SIO2I5]